MLHPRHQRKRSQALEPALWESADVFVSLLLLRSLHRANDDEIRAALVFDSGSAAQHGGCEAVRVCFCSVPGNWSETLICYKTKEFKFLETYLVKVKQVRFLYIDYITSFFPRKSLSFWRSVWSWGSEWTPGGWSVLRGFCVSITRLRRRQITQTLLFLLLLLLITRIQVFHLQGSDARICSFNVFPLWKRIWHVKC